MDIRIDPEFRDIAPPLAADERAQLESLLVAEGCRHPLVLWDGVIVDGHNRYAICTANDIPFETEDWEFESRDDAIIWIVDNQKGRRNVSDFDMVTMQLRKKDSIAAKAKAYQACGQGGVLLLPKSAKAREPMNTRQEIADAAGVSGDTVSKVEQIQKAHSEGLVDDATINKLRRKETSINKVANAIKESKTAQEVAEKIERKPEPPKPPPPMDGLEAVARFDDVVIPVLSKEINRWPKELHQLFIDLTNQYLEQFGE
jgi:hypothetical protein